MTAQAAPGAKLVRHDIAAGNVLYGDAHLITLRLPETWDIAPGVGRPEVVAAHTRHNRRWIVSGRAWYVLYHRQLGWALELFVESSVPRKQRQQPEDGSAVEMHGHPATMRRWERQRGVFRPKTITFVEVTYTCEQSDRFMRLELSGRCPPEGFEELLSLLPEWECH